MIPITRPQVGTEEQEAASAVIATGWLSQGVHVAKFEAAVANYVGARHAVATSNCTTALHLALLAAGVGPGDEVICPSFSFIATANAIVHVGARPVFVDVDERTYNIDPDLIEAAVTRRTRVVMPVDQIGLAADIPAVLRVSAAHGLSVVEDAAPALGATVAGRRVGSLSLLTCFSFHPRKSITTGEGGMVTTDDEDLAARMRRLRSHGASTSDLARHGRPGSETETYDEVGFNYRMTDIQGAIGTVQMQRLDTILAERRRLALRYREMLANIEEIELPYEPPERPHTYQSFCVRLRSRRPRADIMGDLHELGIATRRGVMAIHEEPFYRGLYPHLSLPITERATAQTLLLPLYVGMTEDDQLRVVESLTEALRASAAAGYSDR